MFKELRNQALVSFNLVTDGPLSIHSGSITVLDPSVPDMQVVRIHNKGKLIPFMPGSSIKGIMRARAEKIIQLLGGNVCDIFNAACDKEYKSLREEHASGKKRYYTLCPACRLFGSALLGGRIAFTDALPIGEVKLGVRNGVGINRITGGSQRGALYDFEVVEDAVFAASFTLTNYALWQLKLMMFVLHDIDDGYVAFGGATTRGNGIMKVQNVKLEIRDYRQDNDHTSIMGYDMSDKIDIDSGMSYEGYFWRLNIDGLENIDKLLQPVDVAAGIAKEADYGNPAQR